MTSACDVAVIGGGMFTTDVILPSLYHLQRVGEIGTIHVCARHTTPLKALAAEAPLLKAFPGQSFVAHPSLETPEDKYHPELYKEVIASLAPRQLVVIATPDHVHYDMVMTALAHDQHVLCVKPLVLRHEQAEEIAGIAAARGLYVGVEYHKRFDRRSLEARQRCQDGQFGEFILGEARLMEPYFYRHSNFQTWFTCENSDPFIYVGCHYVDLVYFITGLRPVSVSVEGVKRDFPNGKTGYLWSAGRVRFENGALLSVINGLGYPDAAGGGNDQGITMYFEGDDQAGMIRHQDQFRGVEYSYVAGEKRFHYINPDFFRLVPWDGDGLKPVGYGYESVAGHFGVARRIEAATAALTGDAALARRQELLRDVDQRGLMATAANSSINEQVVEAARASILNGGIPVEIPR